MGIKFDVTGNVKLEKLSVNPNRASYFAVVNLHLTYPLEGNSRGGGNAEMRIPINKETYDCFMREMEDSGCVNSYLGLNGSLLEFIVKSGMGN